MAVSHDFVRAGYQKEPTDVNTDPDGDEGRALVKQAATHKLQLVEEPSSQYEVETTENKFSIHKSGLIPESEEPSSDLIKRVM